MQQQKAEQAARVAWLYFVANLTQLEIAARLNVSRPTVQRLIAGAAGSGMVQVRLNHPSARCMELARQLQALNGIRFCEVAFAEKPTPDQARRTVAIAAATVLEKFLLEQADPVLAIGSGRTMRAVVEEISQYSLPRSRILSPVGVIARDGSFNRYDCGLRMADKAGGKCFLLPAPLVSRSAEERAAWHASAAYERALDLQRRAVACFAGVGKLDSGSPLIEDGFITEAEMRQLRKDGAVGEMLGWPLDRNGQLIAGWFSDRVTSLPLKEVAARPLIACASGGDKVPAILAALRGGWLTGLVTDAPTAELLLRHAKRGG